MVNGRGMQEIKMFGKRLKLNIKINLRTYFKKPNKNSLVSTCSET